MNTDVLFVLAILGFFLLRQIASQRQAAQRKTPVGREEAGPQFDEALDEIRRSLGLGPAPRPEPESHPAPIPRSAPVPRPSAPPKSVGEFHAVDTGRPDFEARFERGESTFHDPLEGHTHAKPVAVAKPLPAQPGRPRLLATKRQLRDAFLLKEIVGPPRARKREIR